MLHSLIIFLLLGTLAKETFKGPRIFGGQKCSINEFSYMALLRIDYEYEKKNQWGLCGGTFLSTSWVLSAAHCFIPTNHTVKLVHPLILMVTKTIIHPDFIETTLIHDIALLSIDLSNNVRITPVVLPSREHHPCEQGLIVGWGVTEKGPVQSADDLQCAVIPLLKTSKCAEFYKLKKTIITDGNICTFSNEGVDACQGDSGGPLMCQGVQVGVISWGMECADSVHPGVYTRVDRYLGFIRGITGLQGNAVVKKRISKYWIYLIVLFCCFYEV